MLNNSNQVTRWKHKGNCQDRSENTPIYLCGVFRDLQHCTLQPKENTDLRSPWGKYHPLPGTSVHHTEQGCARDRVVRFRPFQKSFREGQGAGGRLAPGHLAARHLSSPASFNPRNGEELPVFARTEMPETTSVL